MDPLIGRTLDNKYLVEKLLGKGGMGSVYQAIHTGTKRTVAVKVIAPQYMRNRELLIRFQREAEASGRLRHPNVVNVTDFGVTVIETTAVAYLVMEYLDGETLHEHLQKQPFISPTLACEILEQVSLGVTEAHSHGILHRDLKPQNIWMQPDGRGGYIIKVLDFGIAKLADPSALTLDLPDFEAAPNDSPEAPQDENATQALALTEMGMTSAFADASGFSTTIGSTLGTPAFMSPEQCSGKAVSEKSDLYSLAMMAYLMLAGELPFKGNARDLIEQQILKVPEAPHLRNAKLSPTVSEVILESLDKEPERRAPNPLAFVARLQGAVDGEVVLLKDSRTTGSSNSGVWFAILFIAILLPALLLSLARLAGRYALNQELLPASAIFATIVLFHAFLAYAAAVFSDMQMTLWAKHIRTEEPSVKAFFQLLSKALRLFPAGFRATTLTLHPVRHAIAHIAILLEGLPWQAARARSQTLLHGSEHVAIALLVRRLSVAFMVTFYLPFVLIIAQLPIRVVFREYFGEAFGGSLSIASFSFMPIYGSFLLAWSMLYERCRRGQGEETSLIAKRYASMSGKVGQRWRLGTRLWAAVPVLMVVAMVAPPILNRNEQKNELLNSAALEGRYADMVEALDNGADPNYGRGPGRSPLLSAVQNGDMKALELLFSRGSKLKNFESGSNTGPLHYAVIRRRPEMVRYLLDHGARIDVEDNTRDTPLSLAAKSGQVDIVKLLLARGADRMLKDENGKTALDHARKQGHTEIARLLEAN